MTDQELVCHRAIAKLVLEVTDPAELLGALLTIRATVQAALKDLTEKIQREHPGALI